MIVTTSKFISTCGFLEHTRMWMTWAFLATKTFLILWFGDVNTDATTVIRKLAECSFSFWTLLVSHGHLTQKDSTFRKNFWERRVRVLHVCHALWHGNTCFLENVNLASSQNPWLQGHSITHFALHSSMQHGPVFSSDVQVLPHLPHPAFPCTPLPQRHCRLPCQFQGSLPKDPLTEPSSNHF